MEIRVDSIPDAHIKVCEAIEKCEDRYEYLSEDNEVVWEYPEPVLIIVENAFEHDMISPICGFGQMAMEQYANDLLNGTDNEFVYTYHDRLFKHEVFNYTYDDYCSKVYYLYELNQIDGIINKLKCNPTSRRAQAITWYPEEDLESSNPPCLQRMQFMIRNGKLDMHVTFRSNDCLSAINQNMYAFVHLQEHVARELNVDIGIYTHYITSAHFYPVRDKEEYDKLRRLIYK